MTVREVLNKAKDAIGENYKICNANTNWCQMFVNWLFVGTDNDTHSSRCTPSVEIWKNKGRFDNVPHIGDIVYFQGLDEIQGDYDHVGIVTNVSNGRIYTIEGNTGGALWTNTTVGEYEYSINNPIIGGYAHPFYDDVTSILTGEYSTSLVNTQLFAVEMIQRMLNKTNNASLICDGYYGQLTEKAVRHYQSTHGLVVDGIAGKNTITSLTKEVFNI